MNCSHAWECIWQKTWTPKWYIYNDYNHKCLLCAGPKARFWKHKYKPDMAIVPWHLTAHWGSNLHVRTMWAGLDKGGHHDSPEDNLPRLEGHTGTHAETLKSVAGLWDRLWWPQPHTCWFCWIIPDMKIEMVKHRIKNTQIPKICAVVLGPWFEKQRSKSGRVRVEGTKTKT